MPYFDVGDARQLPFTPWYPVTRTLLAPRLATPLGGGAAQYRRLYHRPLYQFTLGAPQMDKTEQETLFGFLAEVQGDTPFFWDGGEYHVQSIPLRLGVGEGVRTQFYLPQRFITGGLQVYVEGVLMPDQPTLDGATGLLTFAIAPTGVMTAAYTAIYRVVVWQEGETLYQEENFYNGLYRHNGLTLRECLP
jgi:hypothetical protein